MTPTSVKIFYAVVVVGALVVLNLLGYLNFVKAPLLWTTKPVFAISTSVSVNVKAFFESIFDIKGQLAEKSRLEQEVRMLRTENILLKKQSEESTELRSLLGVRNFFSFSTQAASVISRDPSGLSKSVTVDKGQSFGISVGDAVLDSTGNLLGVVETVDRTSAKVKIITDGTIKVDAQILRIDALGVISGSHGVGMIMDLIDQSAEIQQGDEVVTSGVAGRIPPGILIGYIDQQQAREAELFQSATVIPSAEIVDIIHVLIITGY